MRTDRYTSASRTFNTLDKFVLHRPPLSVPTHGAADGRAFAWMRLELSLSFLSQPT
jgi:hypothetical protein